LEAERDRANLEAAARVSAAVGTSLDLSIVLESIVDELHSRFKLQGKDPIPYVMLYDPQAEALIFAPSATKYYVIDNPDYQGLTQLPLKSNIKSISLQVTDKALRALQNGRKSIDKKESVVDLVNDVKAEGFVQFRLDTESELCAALVSEDRLLGVLVLKSSQVGAFTAEDKQLFKLVAEQVALAIDRAERVAKAKRDASVAGAMAWAADVAHDINPDIGYILDRVYWLHERESNLSDKGRGWVREIDARAHQLAGTAQDASSTRSKPVGFALVQMLHEKIATWQPKTCPDVMIEVDGEDVEVSGHREQVWRAIRQLLRNSIEAMQYKGSLWLQVRRCGSDEAELLIKDTGPGIMENVQQRLFREPFSTKSKEEERGFGLLIAQWLIESMRGSICLLPTSKDGGTTFAVRIPLTAENDQETGHAS